MSKQVNHRGKPSRCNRAKSKKTGPYATKE